MLWPGSRSRPERIVAGEVGAGTEAPAAPVSNNRAASMLRIGRHPAAAGGAQILDELQVQRIELIRALADERDPVAPLELRVSIS